MSSCCCQLPVTMYESVIDLVVGQATMLFVELHYTLATEEAERIGVDHVARMSSNEAGESSLGEYLLLLNPMHGPPIKKLSKGLSNVNSLSSMVHHVHSVCTGCWFLAPHKVEMQ